MIPMIGISTLSLLRYPPGIEHIVNRAIKLIGREFVLDLSMIVANVRDNILARLSSRTDMSINVIRSYSENLKPLLRQYIEALSLKILSRVLRNILSTHSLKEVYNEAIKVFRSRLEKVGISWTIYGIACLLDIDLMALSILNTKNLEYAVKFLRKHSKIISTLTDAGLSLSSLIMLILGIHSQNRSLIAGIEKDLMRITDSLCIEVESCLDSLGYMVSSEE